MRIENGTLVKGKEVRVKIKGALIRGGKGKGHF